MHKVKISILSVIIILLFVSACQKFEIIRVMDTKTDSIGINVSKIVAYGTILDVGEKKIIQHGHCWSVNENPTVNDFKTELGEIESRDTFTSELKNIIPGVEHYIRTYVYDGEQYIYGNTLKFTITADNIEFLTDEPDHLNETDLLVTSGVNNIGSLNFINYGHCWSQNDSPTIDDPKSAYGPLDSNIVFSTQINNLNMGRYYIRAYLESEGGVIYSNTIVFESAISVETGIVTYQQSDAIAYGAIKSLGVDPIKDYGHCWSIQTSTPTFNDNHNSLGSTFKLGPYTSEINGLLPNQIYYIRAYATDGIHVFYGKVVSFTTN